MVLSLATISCDSQKKTSAVNTPRKNVYIQLYSVRDDIQKDFKATIAAVARRATPALKQPAMTMENSTD